MYFKSINFGGLDHFRKSLCLSKFQITKCECFGIAYPYCLRGLFYFFQMSAGSDSDLNENDKDPYQQSVQENEIDICEETLKEFGNILNEFPDVPEFNFPADTSHFDFDPNPINQSIFPADTSVQPDLNHNPINQSIFLAGISVQPDINPSTINQGPADISNDNSIGTPSNNLPLRKSTNVLENGPKKNVQGHKSKNQKGMPKNTLFCHRVKNHAAKGVLLTFPVMIEP